MDRRDTSIDELWEDQVRASQETDALRHRWLEEEIYTKVRELRRVTTS